MCTASNQELEPPACIIIKAIKINTKEKCIYLLAKADLGAQCTEESITPMLRPLLTHMDIEGIRSREIPDRMREQKKMKIL